MSGNDDKTPADDTTESANKKGMKRPLGNREAVRKYREKKKARAASLENEVVRLRALNQQLMKRIQSQAGLEAEKPLPANQNIGNGNLTGGYVMNPCNMQCRDQAYCLHLEVDGKNVENASIHDPVINGCEFESLQCMGNQNSLLKEFSGCATDDGLLVANQSGEQNEKVMMAFL
ncbi:putative transcription factor bZIP family [Helianthus debilis subsp. tardiflorus]